MLLAVALKFNGGISSLVGAAAALIAVLLINSQYPKRLRSELIEGNVISEDTQTYQGEETARSAPGTRAIFCAMAACCWRF